VEARETFFITKKKKEKEKQQQDSGEKNEIHTNR
jgi:hypothetical protein